MDAEVKFKARTTAMSYWFTVGVGVVKMEVTSGATKQTTVLKSFTAGK